MTNLEIITKEFEDHKGEFVIEPGWSVKRFVGIGETSEDYYYILFDGRKISCVTCVGRLIFLKGKISDDDYCSLVRIAKLNHFDYLMSNEVFMMGIIAHLDKHQKLLKPLYFDL